MRAIGPVAAVAVFAILAAPAAAQIRYKDDDGVTRWVNSINEVPEKYRAGAVGGPVPKAQPSGTDWEQELREARGAIQRQELQRREADQRAAAQRAGDAWAGNVTGCTGEVNSSSVFGAKSFLAHVSAPGKVQMVGTAQARYLFSKCMRDAGHQVE